MQTDYTAQDDMALEQAAASGDRDAFGQLYNRHFDRVYDFTLRMVRDRDEAADIAQDTFLRAMQALKAGEKRASFSTWVFTIARNLSLNRLERTRRDVKEDEDTSALALIDPARLANPEEAARAGEITDIVWEAAKGLDPKQYSLLDLHLRQGLDSGEIAQVLGVSKGNAYTMLSRMKNAFESSVASLILTRRAGNGCADLNELLRERHLAATTPAIRRLVDRHVAECAVCQERKRRLLSPSALFGAFAAVPAPFGLKPQIADAWMSLWPEAGAQALAGPAKGSLTRAAPKFGALARAWKLALVVLVLLTLLGGGGGVWVSLRGGGDARPSADVLSAVASPTVSKVEPTVVPSPFTPAAQGNSVRPPGDARILISFRNNLEPNTSGGGYLPGPYYDKPGLVCRTDFPGGPFLSGVWQVDASGSPLRTVQWTTERIGLSEGLFRSFSPPNGKTTFTDRSDPEYHSSSLVNFDPFTGAPPGKWTITVRATNRAGQSAEATESIDC